MATAKHGSRLSFSVLGKFFLAVILLTYVLLGAGCGTSQTPSQPQATSPTTPKSQPSSQNRTDPEPSSQDKTAPEPSTQTAAVLPTGTQVDDLDLSGVARADAAAKIKAWAKDKLAQPRLLVYNEKKVQLSLKDLGADLNVEKTLERVNKQPGQYVASVLKMDSSKAKKVLQQKFGKIKRSPQNAAYKIEQDKFVVKPGVPGLTIDSDKLIKLVSDHSLVDIPSQIKLLVKEVQPNVTTKAMKAFGFDSVIGEFSTRFSVNEKNRTANLTSAAKALDKKVIKPGEVFSFNKAVGPRTAETGYKDAYVVINNEYVQGTGGGVCQVSSTLYNAVLLANLPIVARTPHAVTVTYVPLGQDATVNYPNIDFQFKNDTASLIYVRTEVKPGTLTIRLWGKKNGKTVRIVHETEKELDFKTEKKPDPGLPAGKVIQVQAPAKGYIVKSWRVVKDHDGKESVQSLGRDAYAPLNRIIRVGQ